MDHQRTFFDDELYADLQVKRHARRTDPETSHQAAEDIVQSGKLGRQCRLILEAITGRWASSAELSGIALKYTSRISDLRARGYEIRIRQNNQWWYYRWDPPEEQEEQDECKRSREPGDVEAGGN